MNLKRTSFWVFVFLGVCLCVYVSAVGAVERRQINVEVFAFPSLDATVVLDTFHSVGVDHATGNVVFSGKEAWCEIPYQRRQFDFSKAWIQRIEKKEIQALAGAYNDLYVLDLESNSVIGGHGTFPLPMSVKHVAGMAYHKGFLYIVDEYKYMIYKLRLDSVESEEIESYYAKKGITGLASDGEFLYASKGRMILRYDDYMKVLAEYELDHSIDGIAYAGDGEFVGVAKGEKEFYRFRLIER